MDVLRLGHLLQAGSDGVGGQDVQVQQVEGLHRHTGLGPGHLHAALPGPPKDLAGEGVTPLHRLLPPPHGALALACHMLPALVIGGCGSRVCNTQTALSM